MKQNKDNFSTEDIQKLAQSEIGRRLMAMLHGTSTAEAVQKSAAAGDLQAARQALASFLSDPKAQALLKQLEERQNE